ncbi:hypothetical protein CHARACLAT_026574 [Characodon lateralis]|uniref:Uncharacterized protein n=1 Tax=Characodon lateralis TaxID=208331 RepID=A0ABU7CS70_9TELE|nr:hypothetical protein [Characodon lateralis]
MLPSVALAPGRALVGSQVGGTGEQVLCLFLCVIVTVCACFWVRLGLGLFPLLSSISSLPHYLLAVGVSAHWCTCSSRCLGLGALVCADSLPVAACRDLDR